MFQQNINLMKMTFCQKESGKECKKKFIRTEVLSRSQHAAVAQLAQVRSTHCYLEKDGVYQQLPCVRAMNDRFSLVQQAFLVE